MFLTKGSKSYSILAFKCPRCHEGDLYFTPTFGFKRLFDMPKQCPKCGQAYEMGPGFYWGAMFVSYILVAFYIFGGFGIGFFLMDFDPWWSLGVMSASIIPLYAWFFRVSRSIWINFFVHYKK
ncbi:MAG: DUF983 domain-containing protein [Saprospiraceae bacterium]|nr:DUF983 domain-containing protein [Saprospiraceae bacterium]